MQWWFIDAENIGLNALKAINPTINTRVLVFSKDQTVLQYCQQRLYFCYYDYPTGANQADFALIAFLERVLYTQDSQVTACRLHSHDHALILAFTARCQSAQIPCSIKSTPAVQPKTDEISQKEADMTALFQALSQPRKLDATLRQSLAMSQTRFSRAQQALIANKNIQRVGKLWQQAKRIK